MERPTDAGEGRYTMKKKAKENLEIPGKVVKEYREKRPGALWGKEGEVWGTVKIIEGRLDSGTPFRGECFTPDRTPEEQAAWERSVNAACLDYIDDYIKRNGYEAARARFEVRG